MDVHFREKFSSRQFFAIFRRPQILINIFTLFAKTWDFMIWQKIPENSFIFIFSEGSDLEECYWETR